MTRNAAGNKIWNGTYFPFGIFEMEEEMISQLVNLEMWSYVEIHIEFYVKFNIKKSPKIFT